MPKLGTLYRQYLRGTDLSGPLEIEIIALTQVTVTPHPKAEPLIKWCMWIKGLPEDMPNGILFGPKSEEVLFSLFGDVDVDDLSGQHLTIYPQPIRVAGYDKVAIRFRKS